MPHSYFNFYPLSIKASKSLVESSNKLFAFNTLSNLMSNRFLVWFENNLKISGLMVDNMTIKV
jgi:hypothetical protein